MQTLLDKLLSHHVAKLADWPRLPLVLDAHEPRANFELNYGPFVHREAAAFKSSSPYVTELQYNTALAACYQVTAAGLRGVQNLAEAVARLKKTGTDTDNLTLRFDMVVSPRQDGFDLVVDCKDRTMSVPYLLGGYRNSILRAPFIQHGNVHDESQILTHQSEDQLMATQAYTDTLLVSAFRHSANAILAVAKTSVAKVEVGFWITDSVECSPKSPCTRQLAKWQSDYQQSFSQFKEVYEELSLEQAQALETTELSSLAKFAPVLYYSAAQMAKIQESMALLQWQYENNDPALHAACVSCQIL